MPTNTAEFNDLSIPYGQTTIILGGGYGNMTPTTYYIEDSSADTNTNIVKIPNEVGKTRGLVMIEIDRTGNFTLQLPAAAPVPLVGSTGSLGAGYAATGSAQTVRITSVSTPRSMNDYAKVSCGWLTY